MSGAHAGMLGADSVPGPQDVVASNSVLVVGDSSSITPLQLPGAGELFITLTDLNFPLTLASLDLSIAQGGSTLLGLSPAGTFNLQVSQATTLFADVFWDGQGSTDTGLYNLTATFIPATPVPLPGAATSLVAALGALLLWAKRRHSGSRAQETVTMLVA
jgi:hypothetical protein